MQKQHWILGLLLIFVLRSTKAQNDTSTHQFFVQLDSLITLDTLEEYLEDLNSEEVWYHSHTGLALWQVESFPFTMADGTQVFDINTVIRRSTRKTKILEATFNVTSTVDNNTVPNTGSCFDPLNFSMAQGNNNIIKLAILDTGIDPNIQTSTTGELNYNLINYTGYDYVNNDPIPEDEHGHGTHIAGIIHSITNGIDSLGSNIQFYIYKTHDSLGQALMSNVVKALLDIGDNNLDVVNMSFGMQDTFNLDSFFPMRIAVQYALERDIALIASAGNNGFNIDNYNQTILPAGFPEGNLITVAALHCNDSLTSFSNFGPINTDIAALGYKIPGPDMAGGIAYQSGTSQAAAVVSAVTALLGTYSNNFQPAEIKCALINGDTNLPSTLAMTRSEGKINPTQALSLYQNPIGSYTVNNTSNSGPGSLRYAFESGCGVDDVFFQTSLNGLPIQILDKSIFIDSEVTLHGHGITNTIIQSANLPPLVTGFNADLNLINLAIINSSAGEGLKNGGNLIIHSTVKID